MVACGLALACSTANPEFDAAKAGDDREDDGGGASSGSTSAGPPSTTRAESSGGSESAADFGSSAGSEVSTDDAATGEPPVDSCELAPSAGLRLAFGDPSSFGNTCPNGVSIWARVDVSADDVTAVSVCQKDCTSCAGIQPIAAAPLVLTDHVPVDTSVCLRVEAEVPLGHDDETCFWGALTVYDAELAVPYLVATAHGSDPTPTGALLVGSEIPTPEPVLACGCDTLRDAKGCCAGAREPVEFWGYPLDGTTLLPGDSVSVPIAEAQGFEAVFEVFQAHAIPTCEGLELDLSWAVYALL